MQMATVLTDGKPTQRDRKGEVSEGLPGSTLERGMREEKHQELGRPCSFLRRYMGTVPYRTTGRLTERPSRKAHDGRESDQLTLLGDGGPVTRGRG